MLGGTSGIGLACVSLAASEGASVVVAGRSAERLESARQSLGEDARVRRLDVTEESAVRGLFEEVGGFDHLIVCAAETASSAVVGSDPDSLRSTFETRVWGGYFAAKHAAPQMSGGSITFMSGLSAHRPYPGSAMTAASTGAIEAFSRALALELAPTRVNAVCPGIIDTPLLDGYYGDGREEFVRDLSRRLPVGRIGTPKDIADATLFLMTSGFITGTTLRVDGGGALV